MSDLNTLAPDNRDLSMFPGEYGLPFLGKTVEFVKDTLAMCNKHYERYGPVSRLDMVKNQPIKVDKNGISNFQSHSKIIRISLLTPKLGEGIESIDQLKKSELAWTSKFQEIKKNNYSYEVIYENDILKPWKLILKK